MQLLTSNSTKQSPMEIGTLSTFLSVYPKQTQVLLPRQNYRKQWCHKLPPDKLFSKQHIKTAKLCPKVLQCIS